MSFFVSCFLLDHDLSVCLLFYSYYICQNRRWRCELPQKQNAIAEYIHGFLNMAQVADKRSTITTAIQPVR